MVFISVNTPTKTKGLGAGQASDLRGLRLCTPGGQGRDRPHDRRGKHLPVRTAQAIKEILAAWRGKARMGSFSVLSNPEFLAEGTAISDLEGPDRVLIGGEDAAAIDAWPCVCPLRPQERILRTIWSSELSKFTANAFLAQRISSINSTLSARPPAPMCVRWRGPSAQTAASAPSFCRPDPVWGQLLQKTHP